MARTGILSPAAGNYVAVCNKRREAEVKSRTRQSVIVGAETEVCSAFGKQNKTLTTRQSEECMKRMSKAAVAVMACLLGTVPVLAQDTLWVRKLDLGSDEYGYGIAQRGNAMAVVGSSWTGTSNDILLARMNQDGDTVWTRTHDGGSDDGAYSVCLDARGNAWVAGYGYADRGAGPSSRRRPGDLGRIRDAFAGDLQEVAYVAKYDSLGALKWFRADSGHMANGIAVDSAGNCYLSGAVANDSGYDLWLAKLDSSGNTVWTKTLDLTLLDVGYRLAIDQTGNIVGCGLVGTLADFDCLVLRFTPAGDTLWTRRYNRAEGDVCASVAVDPRGNILVSGRTMRGVAGDALVLKYDANGTILWAKTYDFNLDDGVLGVACDPAGNVYAAGYTGADYVNDWLTIKLDSMGDLQWTATLGGFGDDQAGDVVCGPDGNPVVAGYVTDTLTFGYDVLLVKYAALTGVAESPSPSPARAVARSTITAAPSFSLAVPTSGRYEVRLCDATGRTRQSVHNGNLSEGVHRFSLAGLPAGHYFVRVAAPDGGTTCQRLVLAR